MRAIIISDTHGSRQKLYDALSQLGAFDVLVHLGDGVSDTDALRSYINADIIAVKGNNDIFSFLPESRIIELCGHRAYCCHGHTISVRSNRSSLARLAKESGCDIALYGHTHKPADETIDGVRCLNPGSIGYPVGKRKVIEIADTPSGASVRFIETDV